MSAARSSGVLAFLFAIGSALDAQVVRIRAREQEGGGPVIGALVSLRVEADKPLVQALTDELGRAALRPNGPGRYLVRLDRIGYLGTTIGPFVVSAEDTIWVDVVAPATKVVLPELAVASGMLGVCRLEPRASEMVAILWAEARKALIGAEITAEQLPVLEVTKYERGYAPGSSIAEERSTRYRTSSEAPFRGVAPDRLARSGFLERIGGGTEFYAPDARILLSDEFLSQHCFHLVESRDESKLVGLGFSPVPRRSVPDVTGTLWLDRSTAELRYLEFEFINLAKSFRTGNEGGRVDFVRLPNGGWIVGKWRARVAWHERGGEVALISSDGRSPIGAVLVGQVVDSLGGRPLEGAIVSAGGGAYADTTDQSGRYRLEIPTEGTFSVGVSHPLLSLLDVRPTLQSAALIRGQEIRTDFAVPSAATLLGRLCPTRPIAIDAEAVVAGRMADSSGSASPGEIEVQWNVPTPLRAGHRLSIGEGGYRLLVSSDLEGRFRVCGAPAGVPLEVKRRGRANGREVVAKPGDVSLVELFVPSR